MMLQVVLSLALCLIIPILYYLLKPYSVESIPNATPTFPLIGNAISYGLDPVRYLILQRARYGDIFLVNLGVFKVVFFLGPDGTNAIFKGTDQSGISFLAAMIFVIGPPLEKGNQQA
jgi:sterol 14alpha-demethylase